MTLSFWAKGTNPGGGCFRSSWIRSYDNGTNNGEWVVADNIVLNEEWQFFSFTTKVPNKIHNLADNRLKIPMSNEKRSLNLSTSVALVLSEAMRLNGLI